MQKLTTHKGDTLLLIEVPSDAEDFDIESIKNNLQRWTDVDIKKYEFIGTTSTLTDEQIKELIKDFTFTKGVLGVNWYKCDTLNEFLEANNIDTTKNYCVLNLLSNE